VTPELGIIEAYFGRRWNWNDRHQVISRLAPAGFGYFHYAPKIDAELRRNWRQLHASDDARAISAFAAHCRALGVRFGIGFTPWGVQHDFEQDTRSAMHAKLRQFDSWGIDDLVILFDDMRGDIPDLARRQADICAFILDHSLARRFFFCPSYYSLDPVLDAVFGPRPAAYLETLGRLLDPAIHVYWTGEEVCSAEIGPAHVSQMAQMLGRKIALWDNYPVNDGPRMSRHLHIQAFTGRRHAIAPLISQHAINPASQPTLGCIAALTLPMVYTQADAYQYSEAFHAAAVQVCGEHLAEMLVRDRMRLHTKGLAHLSGDEIRDLQTQYGTIDHPAAREIIDWLSGGYAITGEALQTQ
jgi:hypothetical protein